MPLKNHLSQCKLCPRCCGVDRQANQRGFCGAGKQAKVFRFAPHHGEEPPLSGDNGAGTVFFSHCTLRCLYCQNFPWSQENRGTTYSPAELTDIFRELHARGCHNWDLVSPTPWIPIIAEALDNLRKEGIRLPVVYNTSGFERVEVLADIENLTDIYLTDLRYSREETAFEASGVESYVKSARTAFLEMWRQKGPFTIDSHSIAVSGTICRLLILPGHAHETVENLHWLADQVGTDLAVSIMAQYVPAHRAEKCPGWDRAVTRAEYDTVCRAVEDLGFKNGWVQDFGGIPPENLVGFEMKENNMATTCQ